MLIKLTRKTGREIIVNSCSIRFVYDYDDERENTGVIVFDRDHEIYVKESVDDIMRMINDNQN